MPECQFFVNNVIFLRSSPQFHVNNTQSLPQFHYPYQQCYVLKITPTQFLENLEKSYTMPSFKAPVKFVVKNCFINDATIMWIMPSMPADTEQTLHQFLSRTGPILPQKQIIPLGGFFRTTWQTLNCDTRLSGLQLLGGWTIDLGRKKNLDVKEVVFSIGTWTISLGRLFILRIYEYPWGWAWHLVLQTISLN